MIWRFRAVYNQQHEDRVQSVGPAADAGHIAAAPGHEVLVAGDVAAADDHHQHIDDHEHGSAAPDHHQEIENVQQTPERGGEEWGTHPGRRCRGAQLRIAPLFDGSVRGARVGVYDAMKSLRRSVQSINRTGTSASHPAPENDKPPNTN